MLNPYYVAGFVDGEGCFCISLSKRYRPIPEVRLMFEIELREDDEPILVEIKRTLWCGTLHRLEYERYAKWRPHVKLKVSNFRDISTKVIPFFKRYPLRAKKRFDFERFCQVAELIRSKRHLTPDGIERILRIKYWDSPDALDAHVRLRRGKSGGRPLAGLGSD